MKRHWRGRPCLHSAETYIVEDLFSKCNVKPKKCFQRVMNSDLDLLFHLTSIHKVPTIYLSDIALGTGDTPGDKTDKKLPSCSL